MIRPQPCWRMAGSARRMVWNAAERFTASASFQRSAGKSSIGAKCRTTALLTSKSTRPNVTAANCIISAICAGLPRLAPW